MSIKARIVLYFTFLIALVLQTAPLFDKVDVLRPAWLMLVVFYWIQAIPHRVNVITAMVLGLLWDLVLGGTLGTRGMVMSLVAYFVALQYQQFRNMAPINQAFWMGFFTFIGLIAEFLLEYENSSMIQPERLWSVVVNIILWPWLCSVLRYIRRRYQIQ